MRQLSFSQRMRAGWSKEQLMKYYVISEQQYERVQVCLNRLQGREARGL